MPEKASKVSAWPTAGGPCPATDYKDAMAGARTALREGLSEPAWRAALDHLAAPVRESYPPAQRCLGVLARVWSHHVDPNTQAEIHQYGDGLLSAAAGRGDRLAARVLALTPPKTGAGAPDPARSQMLLARFAETPPWLTGMGTVTRLSDKFRLVHARAQITLSECVYLRAKAEGRLQRSQVKSQRSEAAVEADDRSSMDVGMPRSSHDPAVFWTVSRLCALARRPWSCAEPMNIIRYRSGEKFVSHYDADHTNAGQRTQTGGLRRTTAIGYLSDAYRGGETAFPKLGVKITPRLGDVIVFDNLDDDGRTEPASLHAGLPLIEGEKWILAQWFRRFSFDRLTP